jgi:hypothetical protein
VIRRWVFNFAAAMSLLLCAATATLWVRSRSCEDQIGLVTEKLGDGSPVMVRQLGVMAGARLWLSYYRFTPNSDLPATDDLYDLRTLPTRTRFDWTVNDRQTDELASWNRSVWNRLGMGADSSHNSEIDSRAVFVPYWFVISLTLAPFVYVVFRNRRRRQLVEPEHCARCGYNLTANTSGVCPECGTPVKPGSERVE